MRSRFAKLTIPGMALVAVVAGLLAVPHTDVIAQVRAALVKNVDEPWRTPWETRTQFLPNAGGCFGSTTDCNNYSDGGNTAIFDVRPVPAGKRWVVETATGYMSGGINRTNNIELGYPRGTFVFDGNKWAFGGPFVAGTSFNSAIFSANPNVTFGPGEAPFVRVSALPGLGGYTVIVLSGYLIDATN